MDKTFEFIQNNKKSIVLVLLVICLLFLLVTSTRQYFTNPEVVPLKDSKKYKETILSQNPKIILIDNFVTPLQAKHLIKISDEIKRPSTIDSNGDPYKLVTNVRSSESAHLGKARDKIVKEIELILKK